MAAEPEEEREYIEATLEEDCKIVFGTENFYEIFEISEFLLEDLTQEKLEKAYKKQQRKWHFDKHADKSEEVQENARIKYKLISEIYDELKEKLFSSKSADGGSEEADDQNGVDEANSLESWENEIEAKINRINKNVEEKLDASREIIYVLEDKVADLQEKFKKMSKQHERETKSLKSAIETLKLENKSLRTDLDKAIVKSDKIEKEMDTFKINMKKEFESSQKLFMERIIQQLGATKNGFMKKISETQQNPNFIPNSLQEINGTVQLENSLSENLFMDIQPMLFSTPLKIENNSDILSSNLEPRNHQQQHLTQTAIISSTNQNNRDLANHLQMFENETLQEQQNQDNNNIVDYPFDDSFTEHIFGEPQTTEDNAANHNLEYKNKGTADLEVLDVDEPTIIDYQNQVGLVSRMFRKRKPPVSFSPTADETFSSHKKSKRASHNQNNNYNGDESNFGETTENGRNNLPSTSSSRVHASLYSTIAEMEVKKFYDYEIQATDSKLGGKYPKIIIMDPNDLEGKRFYAFYYQLKKGNQSRYCCNKCKKLGRLVSGKLKRDEENGQEYFATKNNHICKPFFDFENKNQQRSTSSSPTNNSSEQSIRIKSPNFMFQQSNGKNEVLVIFHPQNRTLCYRMNYNKGSYRCSKCGHPSIRKYVTAELIKDDENGEDVIDLKATHVCEPVKFDDTYIIKSPNFIIQQSNGKNSVLIIFTNNESQEFCYRMNKSGNKFSCSKCRKVTAKEMEDETTTTGTGEKVICVKGEHDCEPVRYKCPSKN